MSRIYTFENIRNFRDFGAYKTQSGVSIKPAKLFRSAHLSAATDADMEAFRALNIGLIVDLRHKPERDRQPNRTPVGQEIRTISYPDPEGGETEAVAPHEAFMRERLETAEDARDYMHQSYKKRPDDPGFRKIFADTLLHMAETGENILIHCAAGKDRTGTLAAIIHGALGVDRETIMADYMLTMQAVDIDKYLEPAAQFMREKYERAYDAEALRPMFGVEETYLENALSTIGDMDTYIAQDLAIEDEALQAIRQQYLSRRALAL